MEGETGPSDLPNMKLRSSLSEGLDSLDVPSNMPLESEPLTSSDLPHSGLDDSGDTLLVSSQDTPLFSTSSLSEHHQSEQCSSSLTTSESCLAHPLSSWSDSQSTNVQDLSGSEVPGEALIGLVDYDSDSSFQDDISQDFEVDDNKSSKLTGKGFFQSTKFDILKAMKAEVCKVTEGKANEASDHEVPTVTNQIGNKAADDYNEVMKNAEAEVSDDIEVKIRADVKTKVCEDIRTKVSEDTETKVEEDAETKVDCGSEIELEEIEIKLEVDPRTKVDKDTGTQVEEGSDFKVIEDTETNVEAYTETKVEEDAGTKVEEDAGTKVEEDAGTKVEEDSETKVKEDTETKVEEDTETKVKDDTETKVEEDTITKVEEEIGTKVNDISIKASEDLEDIVSDDRLTPALPKVSEDMEVTENIENEINVGVKGEDFEVNEDTEAKVEEDTEAVKASTSIHGCNTKEIADGTEGRCNALNGAKEGGDSLVTQMDFLNVVKDVKETVNGEVCSGSGVKSSVQGKLKVELGGAVETNANIIDKVTKNTGIEKMSVEKEGGDHDTAENSQSDEAAEANGVAEPGSSRNFKDNNSEAGTSQSVEAHGSKRSLDEDEEIEFESNGDSHNDTDSILQEETERLDQLNLPSQVTPEPTILDGEFQQEMQYKKLVDLLSKSKFYTDVLLRKVEADVVKFSRKRKHQDAATNGGLNDETQCGSPSKQSSPSKRKKILMENQRAMYQIASEVIKSKEQSEKVDKSSGESQSTVGVKPVEEIKQPKYLCGGTLRDYQLEGFQWLKVLYENGVNGILADEMGLGKTIQVIALLSHLVEMKVKGPFLIIGPLSTLPNWMIEFKRFAPQLHVVLFYGSKVERKKIMETLMKRKSVNGVLCYPIIVTSYEIPVFERAFMARHKWKYIIVDEGHKIKNYNTLLAKVLRTFKSANSLILTGTPLQNSLSELWSLLNFLVPEIFNNLDVFESWFRIEELSDDAGRKKIIEEERRKNVLSTLHQILAPFMLRRVKSEVTLDIPKKKEVIVKAPMTEMQLKLYQALLEKNIVVLKKIKVDNLIIPDVDGKRPKRSCTLGKNYEEKSDPDDFANSCNGDKKEDIDAIITHFIRVKMQSPWVALKQIANHPYLIHYPLQQDGVSLLVDEGVIKSSGKFLVLDALLGKLHAKGHKVLIFSTLCILLDIVEDYLSLRSYSYERLDGSVKIADRADAIQRFNSDPNVFLFLLSTRAGGLGVNLTGADTVIFLDSDWNPQADLQAQDRCHRIGQTKPVMVYRLVTIGTIEEQILQRASAKRVLEKMVICKGTSTQKEFDLEELKSILESRDHSDIVYTDGQVLTDEQLEKLLDRSDLLD